MMVVVALLGCGRRKEAAVTAAANGPRFRLALAPGTLDKPFVGRAIVLLDESITGELARPDERRPWPARWVISADVSLAPGAEVVIDTRRMAPGDELPDNRYRIEAL